MGNGVPADAVTVSLNCGGEDEPSRMSSNGIWPLSGTEVRNLTVYDSKLYAATGYWMNTPVGDETQCPGASILVLKKGGQWEVEHNFKGEDTAACLLHVVHFDKPVKATRFIASTWNNNFIDLYVRDWGGSSWHFAQTLSRGKPPEGAPQVRCAFDYTDKATSISRLFLGHTPDGVYSLAYDAAAKGGLGQATLELDTTSFPITGDIQKQNRVMSFAVLKGRLYMTMFNKLFERADGAEPRWTQVFEDLDVGASESGYRGLTPVGDAYFFVAREGGKGAILKLTPPAQAGGPWTQTVSYDMIDELNDAWTCHYGGDVNVDYTIAAYNDMVWFHPPGASHWALFVGFQASVNKYPEGFPVQDSSASRTHTALASYLVWNYAADGKWKLNTLPPVTSQPMVSCRCGAVSPFGDGKFFIAGYDANYLPAHNTGWIVALPIARMLDGAIN